MAYNLARDVADVQKKGEVNNYNTSCDFNLLQTKFEQWPIILTRPSENYATGHVLVRGPRFCQPCCKGWENMLKYFRGARTY